MYKIAKGGCRDNRIVHHGALSSDVVVAGAGPRIPGPAHDREPDLFDLAQRDGWRCAEAHEPGPPHNCSDTSRAPAAAARPGAGTGRGAVLKYLVRCGEDGATDEQIQQSLGMRVQTETPRRRELVQAGLVTDSGRRRPTSSGRTAAVWIATDCRRAAT